LNSRTLAILACLAATTIYGINHTIAKGVMPHYIQPFGFILVRIVGAAILFWCVSIFLPREKIEKRDYGRLLICALLGMGINMLSFFKALELSTPINSAVLITIVPIIVVALSAMFLKERITQIKGSGVVMGLIGALVLILLGAELRQDAPNIPLGNFFHLINAISYAGYLILVRRLLQKYHFVTVLKWLFTIGIVIVFPLSINQFLEVEWNTLPTSVYGVVVFVIVGTTFCTYLFNAYGLTKLKASTVSAFIYVQPLIGILFAMAMGKDSLTPIKIIGSVLILIGLYLATKKARIN